MQAEDRPGVLADVTRILADLAISIEAIVQKEPQEEGARVSVIMLTHRMRERQMNAAIRRIEALPTIGAPVTRIRVEYLAK